MQTLGKEGIGKSRPAQLIKTEHHPCFLRKGKGDKVKKKIKNKKERKVQIQDTYCAYNVQSAETRLCKT